MLDTTKYINTFLDAQDKNLRPATITCKLKTVRQFLDYCKEHNMENIGQVKKWTYMNSLNLKNGHRKPEVVLSLH